MPVVAASLANLTSPLPSPARPGPGLPRGSLSGRHLAAWMKEFQDATDIELWAVTRDERESRTKRTAAQNVLRTRATDAADFQRIASGELTLKQARRRGIDTTRIRAIEPVFNPKTGAREGFRIKLSDDHLETQRLVMDYTEGAPRQRIDVGIAGNQAAAMMVTLGGSTARMLAAAEGAALPDPDDVGDVLEAEVVVEAQAVEAVADGGIPENPTQPIGVVCHQTAPDAPGLHPTGLDDPDIDQESSSPSNGRFR